MLPPSICFQSRGCNATEVTPGSSGPANHHALYSHRSSAAPRSDARRPARMSDDDTRPLFVHTNDSEYRGVPFGSRAPGTGQYHGRNPKQFGYRFETQFGHNRTPFGFTAITVDRVCA
jgi:hypothetical protein